MTTLHRFATERLLYPCLAASALAVGLLAGRDILGPGGYRFLIWNLFLAWLPYLAALWAAWCAGRGPLGAVAAAPVFALWLLFLPNAPYLLTDLVHLPGMDFVWWYDVGTMLAFAWAGCLLGVASLHVVQGAARTRLGAPAGWAVVIGAAALSGLGVYVGRFLRWNSWDALLRPRGLAANLMSVFGDPAAYPRIVGVSGLITCIMLLGYWTLLTVRRAETNLL
ncbi:MAG: DUF1361 domain-containing protein [Chloroflexales bacterium]|nr:DUF1361 domain-containing protein [Chloroflexales bacterium]